MFMSVRVKPAVFQSKQHHPLSPSQKHPHRANCASQLHHLCITKRRFQSKML